MGADGVMSSRSGVLSSSEGPSLQQCLSLEHISLGTTKYTRSGEVRRALGVSLGSASEDLPSRASSFRPSPPVATEELKQVRDSVLNSSIKARERSKMFRDSINKIEKFKEATGSKKRQRTDILSNEKPGGSSLLKMAGQPPRNIFDQSTQKLEEKAKNGGMNKRFRTSAGELKVDNKSGPLSKDQMSNEKGTNFTKPLNGASVPEERMLRLSAVGEGWDKNMMKRKRSVGMVANRIADSDIKRTMHSEFSNDSKLTSGDNSSLRLSGRSNAKHGSTTGSPGTVIKGKISRAPRTGSVMSVNSSSDIQASDTCDGWEQPTSTNKASLDLMQNHNRSTNPSCMLGQWVGQRQQKSSRSRRTHVVPPVSHHEEGQMSSVKFSPVVIGGKNSLNGKSGGSDSADALSNNVKCKSKAESMPSPGLLSEDEDTRVPELRLEEKAIDCGDAVLNGKGKMRAFIFPTKRNKNVLNENGGDGVRRQGRTVRGLSLSRPDLSPSEAKMESVSTTKRSQSSRLGSDKIRSKSGRPPSRKLSDGRVFSRNSESDGDHEELLAAAAAARKASYISCSGRFWKKVEPIFGSVRAQDVSYVKQQLSLSEDLDDNVPVIPAAEYNVLGVFMQKEKADDSLIKGGYDSSQVIDKDEAIYEGLVGGRRLEKFSSMYQRVLSALIDEDDCEGICYGNEGTTMSFQCASDDSHCGSCNYVDADIKDRDRLDSEAESMVDFQIQKRCSGDRFSCNKSGVTSNTTKNASMSDSLYSSGRWLGDDGLSHSDAEFAGGSWHNDVGGPQSADATACVTFPDSQYQLMCVDDKLLLELQSIGLYLDAMPDLADGEEVIDRDISDLKEGLSEQIGKKKDNLVKVDKAIQDDQLKEKWYIEQVAMEQLIQMAYKRRMACRRNNASKTVMRKVSKQAATGFIERTLVRCKNFELTGQSCFSEPALQNILFAAPQVNDTGASIVTDSHTGHAASKCRMDTEKADVTSFSVLDSCIDDLGRGYLNSPQAGIRSSEHGFHEESLSHKSKKRELLLDDVGRPSSRGSTAFGSSVVGEAKVKRSEREKEKGRGVLMNTVACEDRSVLSFSNEGKPKTKLKNPTSVLQPTSSSVQWQGTELNQSREIGLSSENAPDDACQEENIDFDAIEELGISNDPNAPEDFSSWLTGLQDYDSIGLEIPMDDLNMVLM